jgi:ribulose-phosphate 3-epimerase
VMDGIFCPPVTTAPPSLARALAADFIVDVHLMVADPLAHVPGWIDAGAGIVAFQIEGVRQPHRVLQSMAGSGVVRGVALTPSTPIAVLEPLLDELELVLLLAVNPGWSGQRFAATTIERMHATRALIGDRLLAVDGAIPRDGLVGPLVAAGADIIVSGTAVFAGDAQENARAMASQLRDR